MMRVGQSPRCRACSPRSVGAGFAGVRSRYRPPCSRTATLPFYPYCDYNFTQTVFVYVIVMTSIHISTARRILQAPEPVDLKCWTKSGSILELHNAIPLRYNFYEGTQQFKILASNQIRTIRLNLIFEVNGCEVFL